MNNKKRHLKTGMAATGALLGATLTGVVLTRATPTQNNSTERVSATEFPFVEFTRSQAVHLNASNIGSDVGPCSVLFRLFNSEGRVVATGDSMVQPGKTAQLVLTNPPDPDLPGVRGEIALPPGPCKDAIVGSLEIIDMATGEVKAIVGPAL